MREAIQNPLFVEIISTPYFELPPSDFFDEPRIMRNSNLMVRPSREEFNPRIIGGKTGFTNAAQHTLVSYAAHNGHEIIISVLFTSPRGAIFSDTAALMDFIFENLPDAQSAPPISNDYPDNQIDITKPHFPAEEKIFPTQPEEIIFETADQISNSEAIISAALALIFAAVGILAAKKFRTMI
jgi:D-alanyl-D-alanine carboxypeptidase